MDALLLADGHCAKIRKVAKYMRMEGEKVIFDCVVNNRRDNIGKALIADRLQSFDVLLPISRRQLAALLSRRGRLCGDRPSTRKFCFQTISRSRHCQRHVVPPQADG